MLSILLSGLYNIIRHQAYSLIDIQPRPLAGISVKENEREKESMYHLVFARSLTAIAIRIWKPEVPTKLGIYRFPPDAAMAQRGQTIGGALGCDVESLRGPARGSEADRKRLRTGASVRGWIRSTADGAAIPEANVPLPVTARPS